MSVDAVITCCPSLSAAIRSFHGLWLTCRGILSYTV